MGLSIRDLRNGHIASHELDVEDDELVCLVGPSGSGKTLLLRSVADLDPNDGEVHLDRVPRSDLSGPAWRRRVRYLAAESGWWSDTVAEHFRDSNAAARTATKLGLPQTCMAWPVSRLSSGERQRLALVRGLEDRPRALLLDEPTSALDDNATMAVEMLIRQLLDGGTCIVLVSHDHEQAARLGTRHVHMDAGTLRPGRP